MDHVLSHNYVFVVLNSLEPERDVLCAHLKSLQCVFQLNLMIDTVT